jgi:hemerythrin
MAPAERTIRVSTSTAWRDSYSVGIRELDNQHRRLLDLINELDELVADQQESASKTKCYAALNALVKYAESHFITEEGYLQKYAFPKYDLHKTEHDSFVEKVFAMNQKLEKGDPYSLFEIVRFLKDWYKSHILGIDQGYKEFLAEKGAQAE